MRTVTVELDVVTIELLAIYAEKKAARDAKERDDQYHTNGETKKRLQESIDSWNATAKTLRDSLCGGKKWQKWAELL